MADETTKEKITRMLKEGFIQLSRKYGMVGNIPPGKTGIELIREVDPREADSFQERFDVSMKEQFLRVYANHHPDGREAFVQELTRAEFAEWLRQRNDVWQLKQDAKKTDG